MKKLFLITFSLLSTSMIVNAQRDIHVMKSNGDYDGYKNVSESHTKTESTLICSDPGTNACKFGYLPTEITTTQFEQASKMVLDQISNGIKSGTFTNSSFSIDWVGSDEFNHEFNIYIN